MRQLMLDALECHKTEDSFGADECRLEIAVDGVFQTHVKKNLNDGQAWNLNGSYQFRDRAELKLWDEDSPDSDDFLGGVMIGTSLQAGAIATFNGDGARYQVRYRVFDLPDPIVDPVEEALRGFEESTQAGVWPYILKAELLGDIRRTVANSFNVAQEWTALCGPAAIIFELVSRQPTRYVSVCRALYETGEFTSRTKIVRPSSTLLTSRVPSDITLADWMLMACLRDTENALFPVEASSSPIAMGITTPWEMKGWAFEIIGYDRVEYESTHLYGEFEAMRKAEAARNQGGVAFLMVHSAMLGKADPVIGYPNHWVSFLGGLMIDDGVWHRWDSGKITFDCYSWGSKHHVKLDEGPFEDCMWGVVTGRS